MNCTAEVLYHLDSKNSAPDVQVTVQGELRSTEEADKEFYNWIRSLEKELVAENIPGTSQERAQAFTFLFLQGLQSQPLHLFLILSVLENQLALVLSPARSEGVLA